MLTEQWVAIGAGVLAVVGALLPWASVTTVFGSISRSGIDDGGDGLLTAGLGVVGALAARQLGRWIWLVVLAGLGIGGIALYDLIDINSLVDEVNRESEGLARASAGGGLYITLIAGVLMFAAGLTIWDKRRRGAARSRSERP